ncbi:hypothetical protein SNEBB_003523 [Seison nebaliae]|nr:hypothetical protein SNEBB_003523 [Seison nebaliae]
MDASNTRKNFCASNNSSEEDLLQSWANQPYNDHTMDEQMSNTVPYYEGSPTHPKDETFVKSATNTGIYSGNQMYGCREGSDKKSSLKECEKKSPLLSFSQLKGKSNCVDFSTNLTKFGELEKRSRSTFLFAIDSLLSLKKNIWKKKPSNINPNEYCRLKGYINPKTSQLMETQFHQFYNDALRSYRQKRQCHMGGKSHKPSYVFENNRIPIIDTILYQMLVRMFARDWGLISNYAIRITSNECTLSVDKLKEIFRDSHKTLQMFPYQKFFDFSQIENEQLNLLRYQYLIVNWKEVGSDMPSNIPNCFRYYVFVLVTLIMQSSAEVWRNEWTIINELRQNFTDKTYKLDLTSAKKFDKNPSTKINEWCFSGVRTTRFGYLWNVKGFSFSTNVESLVEDAALFSTNLHDGQVARWRIRLMPAGLDEDTNGCISVYLLLDMSSDVQTILAHFRISLLNTNLEEIYACDSATPFKFTIGRDWGFKRFIKRDEAEEFYTFGDQLFLHVAINICEEKMSHMFSSKSEENSFEPDLRLDLPNQTTVKHITQYSKDDEESENNSQSIFTPGEDDFQYLEGDNIVISCEKETERKREWDMLNKQNVSDNLEFERMLRMKMKYLECNSSDDRYILSNISHNYFPASSVSTASNSSFNDGNIVQYIFPQIEFRHVKDRDERMKGDEGKLHKTNKDTNNYREPRREYESVRQRDQPIHLESQQHQQIRFNSQQQHQQQEIQPQTIQRIPQRHIRGLTQQQAQRLSQRRIQRITERQAQVQQQQQTSHQLPVHPQTQLQMQHAPQPQVQPQREPYRVPHAQLQPQHLPQRIQQLPVTQDRQARRNDPTQVQREPYTLWQTQRTPQRLRQPIHQLQRQTQVFPHGQAQLGQQQSPLAQRLTQPQQQQRQRLLRHLQHWSEQQPGQQFQNQPQINQLQTNQPSRNVVVQPEHQPTTHRQGHLVPQQIPTQLEQQQINQQQPQPENQSLGNQTRETRAESKSESQSDSDQQSPAEADSDVQSESQTDSESEVDADSQSQTHTDSEPQSPSESLSESGSESKSKSDGDNQHMDQEEETCGRQCQRKRRRRRRRIRRHEVEQRRESDQEAQEPNEVETQTDDIQEPQMTAQPIPQQFGAEVVPQPQPIPMQPQLLPMGMQNIIQLPQSQLIPHRQDILIAAPNQQQPPQQLQAHNPHYIQAAQLHQQGLQPRQIHIIHSQSQSHPQLQIHPNPNNGDASTLRRPTSFVLNLRRDANGALIVNQASGFPRQHSTEPERRHISQLQEYRRTNLASQFNNEPIYDILEEEEEIDLEGDHNEDNDMENLEDGEENEELEEDNEDVEEEEEEMDELMDNNNQVHEDDEGSMGSALGNNNGDITFLPVHSTTDQYGELLPIYQDLVEKKGEKDEVHPVTIQNQFNEANKCLGNEQTLERNLLISLSASIRHVLHESKYPTFEIDDQLYRLRSEEDKMVLVPFNKEQLARPHETIDILDADTISLAKMTCLSDHMGGIQQPKVFFNSNNQRLHDLLTRKRRNSSDNEREEEISIGNRFETESYHSSDNNEDEDIEEKEERKKLENIIKEKKPEESAPCETECCMKEKKLEEDNSPEEFLMERIALRDGSYTTKNVNFNHISLVNRNDEKDNSMEKFMRYSKSITSNETLLQKDFLRLFRNELNIANQSQLVDIYVPYKGYSVAYQELFIQTIMTHWFSQTKHLPNNHIQFSHFTKYRDVTEISMKEKKKIFSAAFDMRIQVNRMMLSIRSQVFRAMFKNRFSNSVPKRSSIQLNDFSPLAVYYFLEYLHCDKIPDCLILMQKIISIRQFLNILLTQFTMFRSYVSSIRATSNFIYNFLSEFTLNGSVRILSQIPSSQRPEHLVNLSRMIDVEKYDDVRLLVDTFDLALMINIDTLVDITAELYRLADKYDVDQLKDQMESLLIELIDESNVFHWFEFAETFHAERLKNIAIDTIRSNIELLSKTEQWQQFIFTQPDLVVDLYSKTLLKVERVKPASKTSRNLSDSDDNNTNDDNQRRRRRTGPMNGRLP